MKLRRFQFSFFLAASGLILSAALPVLAEDAPPLYPNENSPGRPSTVELMENEIKPHIDSIYDAEHGPGEDFMNQSGAAIPLLEHLKEQMGHIGNEEEPPDFQEHKYSRGAGSEDEVIQNHIHDIITASGANFFSCYDYEIIGFCVPPGPIIDRLVPYVKYYGPPQKVENVDQPFKTGYMTKDQIRDLMYPGAPAGGGAPAPQSVEDILYEDAAEIAEEEFALVSWVLSTQGGGVTPPPPFDPAYAQKAVEDIKTKTDQKLRFRYLDPTALHSGYVYNEYHVMSTGINLYDESTPAGILARVDPIAQVAMEMAGTPHPFVHTVIQPQTLYSEFPSNILLSRWSGATWQIFNSFIEDGLTTLNVMEEKWKNPFACQQFNIDPSFGRMINFDKATVESKITTPRDMLTGLAPEGYSPIPDACQGGNQGPWLPFLNTIQTTMHSTAAAIGTVRGIRAAFYYYFYLGLSNAFYFYTYDNPGMYPGMYNSREGGGQMGIYGIARDGDKVQWSRNEHMDGEPSQPESKVCNPVEKWVLKYGDGNMKHIPDDHWAVTIHWRYWRGCLGGGLPIYPPVPQILQ